MRKPLIIRNSSGSPINTLGEFEVLVILAIQRLGDYAYGVAIEDLILRATDNKLNVRGLYTTLQRLKDKGFIREKSGVAPEQERGPARKYYQVEPAGKRALTDTQNRWKQRESQCKKITKLQPAISKS